MTSTIYMYVEDGAEWEDVSMFLTLESAMRHAASHLLKYVDRRHPWSEVAGFRIEAFRAKPTNPFHLLPTYEHYRIRNLTIDEVELMRGALHQYGDVLDFFEKKGGQK